LPRCCTQHAFAAAAASLLLSNLPCCSLPTASDNLRQNVWLSGTAGQGTAPLRLVVQAEGAAIILDAEDIPRWATNTAPQQAVLMQRGAGDR
jgi:hypothetical protein